MYLPDDQWKDAVGELLLAAQAVVLVQGDTPGVEWELRTITEKVDPARFLLILPAFTPDLYRSLCERVNRHLPKPLTAESPKDGDERQRSRRGSWLVLGYPLQAAIRTADFLPVGIEKHLVNDGSGPGHEGMRVVIGGPDIQGTIRPFMSDLERRISSASAETLCHAGVRGRVCPGARHRLPDPPTCIVRFPPFQTAPTVPLTVPFTSSASAQLVAVASELENSPELENWPGTCSRLELENWPGTYSG